MSLSKKTSITVLAGILIGALAIMTIRFFTYHKEVIHYHANFGLYINGKRETFNNPIYYVEASCGADTNITPYMRAHMHENVNDVVHVEDHAVTWGQFFENLGWYVGSDFIQKPDGTMYSKSGENKLNILINGEDYTGISSLTNMVIKDKDRVLVSFGDVTKKDLEKQAQSIATSASNYDDSQDPSSCSGRQKTTIRERLKHIF